MIPMAGCSGGEIETVFFGRYEQDGIAENGAEPIEWIVAHKDEEKTLLIAKDVLELLPYNALAADDSISLVFWEGSTLREWLNGAFMETAFTPEERARIAETANKNIVENDFHYSEDPDTIDTAFLLSKEEAEEYLRGDNMRIARPSACALAKGARQAGCTFADGAGMLVGQAVVTAEIVCDIAGVDLSLSADDMFTLMAQAAQFDID